MQAIGLNLHLRGADIEPGWRVRRKCLNCLGTALAYQFREHFSGDEHRSEKSWKDLDLLDVDQRHERRPVGDYDHRRTGPST
jgi:hypothetical protein